VLFYNGKKVQMENRDKVVPGLGSTGCLQKEVLRVTIDFRVVRKTNFICFISI